MIVRLFADDTKIRQITLPDDCTILQNDIYAIEKWTEQWLLKLHPQKCKYMRIGKGHPNCDYQMTGQDQLPIMLHEATKEKVLGVIFNS